MKNNYYTYGSLMFFTMIILVGVINKKEIPPIVTWSERSLVWSDFQPVAKIQGDFHASIYSEMRYPKQIDKDDALVYAFMDPAFSEKIKDSMSDDQLLKHEQYHFNITEYYARLLRKAIVNQGQKGATASTLRDLYLSYEEERDKMQEEYDEVSEHNINQPKQLYWQLKIDDLLRETAYYKNPDIYSYYDFTKEATSYYKHLYLTMDYELLTSYPTDKADSKHGECYQVIRNPNETIIKFYKNGVLTDGGHFDTAITKIKKPDSSRVEMHYFNAKEAYNTSLDRCISKTIWQDKDRTVTYFDKDQKPVLQYGAHKVVWKWEAETKTMYSSYYNLQGKPVRNEELIHHKRRTFDEEGRSIKIEMFDAQHQPVNDKEYVSIYQYEFDENHKIIQARIYDYTGKFAIHRDSYNTQFDYDERGNMIRYKAMDKFGVIHDNKEGIAIYAYTYDINDNITSTKRYNAAELPTLGYDDYFMEVTDYDSKNRLFFKAKYYRDYVLAFSDKRNGASSYEYINDSIYNIYNQENYGNVFKNDENIAIVKRFLDQKGQIVKEVYLDHNECHVKYEDNIAMYTYTYDERGNKTSETALDSIEQPVKIYGDATTLRWKYNKHNNKVETTYYDALGKPAEVYGPTYTTHTYDTEQNIIAISSFDQYKKPMSYSGSFTEKYKINRHKKDSIVAYYDTRNQLIKGACYVKNRYNRFGNLEEEAFFNVKNQRIKSTDGISVIKHQYTEDQRYLGYRYYDQYGRPVNNNDGFFEEKRTLNSAGYITSYEYFDKNGSPVLGTDGYHKVVYELDDSYLTVRESIYGTDGFLMNNQEGIAEYEYTRAPSGLTAKIRYFSANREIVEDTDGVAEIVYTPKMNGLYYTEKQLDAKGKEIEEETEEIIEEEVTEEEVEEQETIE